jgi:hypothetical protein
MKLTNDRPFADPEKAARRLMQHAHAFEVVQDGRIYIEKVNGRSCTSIEAHPKNMRRASRSPSNAAGWNCMTVVRFTQSGADLFAAPGVQDYERGLDVLAGLRRRRARIPSRSRECT